MDEISTHKSKIANTSNRLNYHSYIPQGYLHKEHALKLNDNYHSSVMEKVNEYDEVASSNADFLSAAARDIELLRSRLMEREALISEFQKPLRWNNPTRDDLRVANTLIDYFYQLGILLDRANSSYNNWEATLGFQVDRNIKLFDRLVTPSELNTHGDRLQQLAHTFNVPKFDYNAECGWIECRVQLQKKPEKSEKEFKLKDLLTVGNKRSWLITGHPGAGKTSVMIFLGQQLGGQSAQRIALNPHDDEQSTYEPYGFVEMNDLTAILEQINLIYKELELRRQDQTRRFKLVVVIDELGAILDAASKPKDLMLVIRQIAVEGRKLVSRTYRRNVY